MNEREQKPVVVDAATTCRNLIICFYQYQLRMEKISCQQEEEWLAGQVDGLQDEQQEDEQWQRQGAGRYPEAADAGR